MANKNKKKPHHLTATDIALAVLAALGGSVAFITIALVAGSLLFPESWQRQTAAAPSAQPSYYGTLPSRAPASVPTPSPAESPEEPSNEPTREETEEPVQQTAESTTAPTQAPTSQPVAVPTPAPTRTPTAPVQTTAPAAATQPVQNTTAPTQSGSQSGNSGGSGRTEGVPTSAKNLPGSTIVYVSNNANKIHSISNCSGMRNYREMTLDQANSNNYEYCSNCW